MQDLVSIFSLIISAIGLVVAYFAYKISNGIRLESAQIRLIDQFSECDYSIEKVKFLIESYKGEIDSFNKKISIIDSRNLDGSERVSIEFKEEIIELKESVKTIEEIVLSINSRIESSFNCPLPH